MYIHICMCVCILPMVTIVEDFSPSLFFALLPPLRPFSTFIFTCASPAIPPIVVHCAVLRHVPPFTAPSFTAHRSITAPSFAAHRSLCHAFVGHCPLCHLCPSSRASVSTSSPFRHLWLSYSCMSLPPPYRLLRVSSPFLSRPHFLYL